MKKPSRKSLLARELHTFKREKDRLLAEGEGRFVLIKGDKVLGIFDSQLAAAEAGYRQLGYVPLLAKKIERVETPIYIMSGLLDI